jgi:hypothetical protein
MYPKAEAFSMIARSVAPSNPGDRSSDSQMFDPPEWFEIVVPIPCK